MLTIENHLGNRSYLNQFSEGQCNVSFYTTNYILNYDVPFEVLIKDLDGWELAKIRHRVTASDMSLA